ncbi:ribulokinase [Serratia ficaria]|uniref:ribulokinase n=1 Tax=Serratia ficaria TaxID=61651 RepID=UPI0021C9D705|nr:ribulokinase [Serratia ficaria]
MAQQNVKGATTKPTAASAVMNGDLSDAQVYDLFRHVQRACGGRSTGTMAPPSVPAEAEYFVLDEGDFDSLAVWVVDGWPVAASDEANWTHWQINAQ